MLLVLIFIFILVMSKSEIFRYVLTAIVAVASALLTVFFGSCASTTRVITRSSTTNGSASSTVSVTTDARQDLEMKVDSSLNLVFPSRR